MELINYPKVLFDFGARHLLEQELGYLRIARPLLITDQGLVEHGVFDQVRETLSDALCVSVFDRIPEVPTVQGIEDALTAYCEGECDGIVAIGGGSVLDSGKALRVLVTHEGPLSNYFGFPPKVTPNVPPFITIPTTGGTGAEVTPAGGFHVDEGSRAEVLFSPFIRPNTAICDPELTLTLPPRLTAATGMDALAHCIEAFFSNTDNPPVEAIALDGIKRLAENIERAVADGSDKEARWQMLMGACEGGLAMNIGLGSIHVLADAFSNLSLHHGTFVALATPHVLRFLEGHIDEKIATVHAAMNIPQSVSLADGIAALNEKIGMPNTLSEMNCDHFNIDECTDEATKGFFNGMAPVIPERDDYYQIIKNLIG